MYVKALGLLKKGDIMLTMLGHNHLESDQVHKKVIFGQQLLTHVPLAAHIRSSLEQEATGALPEERFLELLEEFVKVEEAQRVLKVAIEWGRYGEVYEYDFHSGRLKLPEGDEG